MLDIAIEDIMCDTPVKVRDDAPLSSVAHLLLRHQINGILVVKARNEHHLVGVITTTDLLRLVNFALNKGTRKLSMLKQIGVMSARSVATKDVVTVQKDDSVLKVIALMHRKNIHTIPVYDKNKIVGVIGKHDILNVAFV